MSFSINVWDKDCKSSLHFVLTKNKPHRPSSEVTDYVLIRRVSEGKTVRLLHNVMQSQPIRRYLV